MSFQIVLGVRQEMDFLPTGYTPTEKSKDYFLRVGNFVYPLLHSSGYRHV